MNKKLIYACRYHGELQQQLTYQWKILCWQSLQLVCQVRVKTGEVHQVNFHPVLAKIVMPLQLVPGNKVGVKFLLKHTITNHL